MKTCPDCQQTKALDDFPRNAGMADGRGRYCRPCMQVRSRESYRRRQARKGKQVRVVEEAPPGTRRCPDCAVLKPLEDFPRHKNGKEGRHVYCKPCHNLRGQET